MEERVKNEAGWLKYTKYYDLCRAQHRSRLNKAAFAVARTLSELNQEDREEVLDKASAMLQSNGLIGLLKLQGWGGFWCFLLSHWWLIPCFFAVGAFLGHLLIGAYPIPC